jgi:hypothetical protein
MINILVQLNDKKIENRLIKTIKLKNTQMSLSALLHNLSIGAHSGIKDSEGNSNPNKRRERIQDIKDIVIIVGFAEQ